MEVIDRSMNAWMGIASPIWIDYSWGVNGICFKSRWSFLPCFLSNVAIIAYLMVDCFHLMENVATSCIIYLFRLRVL